MAGCAAHRRVVFFLSKAPGLDQFRPISIAPVAYRLWSAIRATHRRGFLSQFLLENHAGLNGPGAIDLLSAFDVELDIASFPVAACLDFAKALDSCDWHTCSATDCATA